MYSVSTSDMMMCNVIFYPKEFNSDGAFLQCKLFLVKYFNSRLISNSQQPTTILLKHSFKYNKPKKLNSIKKIYSKTFKSLNYHINCIEPFKFYHCKFNNFTKIHHNYHYDFRKFYLKPKLKFYQKEEQRDWRLFLLMQNKLNKKLKTGIELKNLNSKWINFFNKKLEYSKKYDTEVIRTENIKRLK